MKSLDFKAKTINGKIKLLHSDSYNYHFNLTNGYFVRWGKTLEDDPDYSPFGPEILDIEISTICSNGCNFCYKSNTSKGINMTFEQFKIMFDKFPKALTQIAFGIGDVWANPDLWKIMEHCRINQVIPNITINGNRMAEIYYDNLKKYCGSVAVSLYDYDICYDAVEELTNRGMEQVNIHALLSEETYDRCMQVMKDSISDIRLSKLNAIVFLWLKPKGDRNNYTQLKSKKKFVKLLRYALENMITFGFDSCSAPMVYDTLKEHKYFKAIKDMIEPCESTLFSYYINAEGIGYPCSFSEGLTNISGINMFQVNDFLKDVWFNKENVKFRNNLIKNKDCNGCRKCQIYNLTTEEQK